MKVVNVHPRLFHAQPDAVGRLIDRVGGPAPGPGQILSEVHQPRLGTSATARVC